MQNQEYSDVTQSISLLAPKKPCIKDQHILHIGSISTT